jgi:hypothetical protein
MVFDTMTATIRVILTQPRDAGLDHRTRRILRLLRRWRMVQLFRGPGPDHWHVTRLGRVVLTDWIWRLT